MLTFRYLLGVSVGAAIAINGTSPSIIALASTEPAASQAASQPLSVESPTESDSSTEVQSKQQDSEIVEPAIAQPLPGGTARPTESLGQGLPGPQTTPELYLDPDANPLQFPTTPEEVQIQGTIPLTLEQALALARRNDRELQVALLQLEQSQAQLRESLAAEYPTVRVQGDLTRQQTAADEILGQVPREPGQANPDSPTINLGGSLEINYDVYTSGFRSANIRAAERNVRLNELEIERLEEQLRLDVIENYYDLQGADEQVRIREQAVINAESSLRDAQALERAGVGTRFSVLQSQVQLAEEEQRLTDAIAQQRLSRRTLAERLSLPQFVDIAAADPVDIAGSWVIPLERSIVLAFKNRAELEQQLVTRELNEQQRRSRLASLGPQVSLFARYDVLRVTDDNPQVPGRSGDGYQLGARVTWNLFDGGLARAQADQEEAEIEIAETNFADQRNSIRLQVEQAYFDLVSTFENIGTSTVALEQAREALRLARLRFQAGVGTQTDVINSETDLTDAEFNRIQAILGYNRALARLQRAISNLPEN